MNNEALFKTLDRSPVVDLAYQYTNQTVEESYIERDYYVPYSGEMRLADSIFCRGPIIIDSLTREVEYDKVEIPSKICDMLEDKMSFCSERLNNGEVVYISLSYTILDGEVEERILPNGDVESRQLVPGNYRDVYCFVPNKIFSSDTVHNIEELSIMVPDSLDIDRAGSDRIFERGFDSTYPVKIKTKNNKDYFVNSPYVLYRGDEKDYLKRFLARDAVNSLTNDDFLAKLSDYYSNKENADYGDFEDWNNLDNWNNSNGNKHKK